MYKNTTDNVEQISDYFHELMIYVDGLKPWGLISPMGYNWRRSLTVHF